MNLLPSQHAPASQALGTGTAAYATAVDSSDPAAQPSQRTRMRLAYLTTEYPAVSHTFIRRELLELERRGHSILRLSVRTAKPDLPDPADRAERDRTTAILGGSKLTLLTKAMTFAIRSPRKFLRGLALALAMSRKSDRGVLKHIAYCMEAASLMARLRAERIQHLHVHFGTNSTTVARLIRRMGGPAYSFTVHGPDEFDAAIGLDLSGKITDSSFVIGISDFGAAQLKRWVPPELWHRIHVVRCTVDATFLDGAITAIPRTPTFVCVGRLAPQKGQMVLLDAVARLKAEGVNVQVVLAGDGELRSKLQNEITARSLQSQVAITGWISGAAVRENLLASRALILPSFAEGLPVAIMEAMALGRPVISTYIAGIPELVTPARNGWLVPSGRADLLASAIKAAAACAIPDLELMGTAARQAVCVAHNVRTEVDKLETLMERAVAGATP